MFILAEELHNNWDYVMSPGKTVQALSLTNTGSKNTHILLENDLQTSSKVNRAIWATV